MSYAYDLNGLRTSKVVDGVTHTYLYAGGKLLRETYGGNTLDFFYDQAGQPYALTYNGTTYYYILNVQGDVTAIVDGSNNNVAAYRYDPYGKVITATGTLADINPLRYRGYYYDTETGFYYLQSRYYDPSICRFINADSYVSTGQGLLGCNMFAYCGNDPVIGYDPTGMFNIRLLSVMEWIDDSIEPAIILLAEHRKRGTTNPSNRNKHEEGFSRKQRDNNGEKKNRHKSWKPNPNKRNVLMDGLIVGGAVVAIFVILADDVTVAGVANDTSLVPLLTLLSDFVQKYIS